MDAPLHDYLVTETEGLTGWKYPKLQDLKKFKVRKRLKKSLAGVELHPDADEKAQTREGLFFGVIFSDLRNKLVRSPPLYIVIWTKFIRDWPSIINGGCRFAPQVR